MKNIIPEGFYPVKFISFDVGTNKAGEASFSISLELTEGLDAGSVVKLKGKLTDQRGIEYAASMCRNAGWSFAKFSDAAAVSEEIREAGLSLVAKITVKDYQGKQFNSVSVVFQSNSNQSSLGELDSKVASKLDAALAKVVVKPYERSQEF